MTLLELLHLLKKHLVAVVALPVVFALAVGALAWGFVPNSYTAKTSMYVLAKSGEEVYSSTLQSTLSAGQMITNDVAALIKSGRVIKDTAASLGLGSISGYSLSVSNQTNNRVITLSVEGPDPRLCADIANAMAVSVSKVAREVMDVQSVNVIDEAVAPSVPSGPNRPLYVAVAAMAGLFVAVAAIVLVDMLNTRVRTTEEAEELLGVPVIGRFPTVKGDGRL